MKKPSLSVLLFSLTLAFPASSAVASDHGHGDGGHDAEDHAAPPAKKADDKSSKSHEAPAASASKESPRGSEAAPGAPDLRVVVKGAFERLKDGNRRYAEGKPSQPRRGKDQRTLVAKAQLPFAIIVGCADSRVPPEIVFDQGLGDLFVVRVAGNVIDDPTLGSIEYAVEHLGSRLIVVLGHERCGAVDAACKGGNPGGHVGSLVEAIRPAVEVARRKKGDNLLADAVKSNVQRVVDQLKGSWPVLGPEVREDHLSVVGGVYDLETGLVEFLP